MTRIAPHGRVSYSQRLTVTARCKMNLRKVTYRQTDRQMTDDRQTDDRSDYRQIKFLSP